MEERLHITLTGSLSGAKPPQRATVRSLGLRRRHQTVQQPDRPEIRGMVAKVAHLVRVGYVGADQAVAVEPGQEPKGAGKPAAGASVDDAEVARLRAAEEEALGVAEEHSSGDASSQTADEPDPGAGD